MWIASMRIHTAMALTFTTLLLGFIICGIMWLRKNLQKEQIVFDIVAFSV